MTGTQIEVKKQATPGREAGLAPLHAFRNEFDRIFDRFSKNMMPWRSSFFGEPFPDWLTPALPSVDVAEDKAAYTVTAELPGLTASDVDVSLDKDYLVIKGEKLQEKKQEDKNYHLSERSYGAFERRFLVPEGVERDKIKAEVANGVLTVTLPKNAEAQAQAKKISVTSG